DLFLRLASVIQTPIRMEHVEPSYTTFVLEVDDIETAISESSRQGIRLRQTWPVFQDYSPAQRTSGVKWIANHYALLNLGQYTEQRRQARLFNFLRNNGWLENPRQCEAGGGRKPLNFQFGPGSLESE
ncbi:MAG: hypothetical protein ABSC05_32315, partial [Candidatus Solibacter sp.]